MKMLTPYHQFSDTRGSMLGINNSHTWEEINYFETEAGQIRGGHYHKLSEELFFIIEGRIEIEIYNLKGHLTEQLIVGMYDSFIIEPMEVHTFHILERSRWINAMKRRMDVNFPDIFKPS